MALLLAMYQKMRLIREINQDTLKLTKITSKINRVTKNIDKAQKYYTGLIANLDKQAEMMKSQASVFFQNMAGLGVNSVNLNNYTGMNGFIINQMSQMFAQGIKNRTDANGNKIEDLELGTELFQRMYTEYMSNGGRFLPTLDENNKQTYDENGYPQYKNFKYEEVQAFTQAQQSANMAQQQAQLQVQSASQQYSNNVSIWLEAAKSQIEAEQDEALEPLHYEDTMLQLEKEQLDARLQRLRADKESYDNLVSEEAKNAAPTFGLR